MHHPFMNSIASQTHIICVHILIYPIYPLVKSQVTFTHANDQIATTYIRFSNYEKSSRDLQDLLNVAKLPYK